MLFAARTGARRTTVCQRCAAAGLIVVQDKSHAAELCTHCDQRPAVFCSVCAAPRVKNERHEYTVALIDGLLVEFAGASFEANGDEEAEYEARALALMHDAAVRARLHRKGRPDVWWIDL